MPVGGQCVVRNNQQGQKSPPACVIPSIEDGIGAGAGPLRVFTDRKKSKDTSSSSVSPQLLPPASAARSVCPTLDRFIWRWVPIKRSRGNCVRWYHSAGDCSSCNLCTMLSASGVQGQQKNTGLSVVRPWETSFEVSKRLMAERAGGRTARPAAPSIQRCRRRHKAQRHACWKSID